MNHLTTIPATRGDALWHLPRGRVLTVPKADIPRRLRLVEGRLWLTGEGRPDAPACDEWLDVGDSLRLEAGASVLAEGWPVASFELLEEPQAAAR